MNDLRHKLLLVFHHGFLIKISIAQLWEPEAVHDPMDVGIGARLAAVVEMVIAQYQWLFQVRTHSCKLGL